MNIVPKCKECEYLYMYTIGKKTYYECCHEETQTILNQPSKRIYSESIKTSPKWCPLRSK